MSPRYDHNIDKNKELLTKDMPERIVELEAKLNLSQQLTGVGFWEWNIQTNLFILDNTFMAMLGNEAKTTTGTIEEITSLHHPEELEEILFQVNQHLQGKTEAYEHKHQLKTKDGNWIWVKTVGKVISWDDANEPLWFIGSVTDITQQVQLENFFYSHHVKDLKKKLQPEDALQELINASHSKDDNILNVCSCCKKYKNEEGKWLQLEHFIKLRTGIECSHGLCQCCLQEMYGQEEWFQSIYNIMLEPDDNK